MPIWRDFGAENLLEQTYNSVSKNLKSYDETYNFTDGILTSIVYDVGGGATIVKTLNYTDGELTSIVLSGDTPAGINLTKTLSRTDGELTEGTYS